MQILALVCNSCADGEVSLVFSLLLWKMGHGSPSAQFAGGQPSPPFSCTLWWMAVGSGGTWICQCAHRNTSCCSAVLPKLILLQKPSKELRTSGCLFASVNPSKNIICEKYNATCAGLWSWTAPILRFPCCLKG